ncbi:chloride channel protein 7 [Brevipalpus obovatus]|uniref:chloride channel protein 7 n=1 Tax=Brevipalpus obovatus TaxID=246614 RepID=UPI003D9E86C7
MSQNFLSQKYESLDYDQCENFYFLLEQRNQRKNLNILRKKSVKRWFIVLLIGILTALTACAIVVAVDKLSYLKYTFLAQLINDCDDRAGGCYHTPLFVWLGLNAVLVGVGCVMVAYWAPVAAASGIPVIKCYLNGVKVPQVVRIQTFIAKTVGVIFSVVGGLASGKEGPMIHSGAIIAAGVSQGKSTSLNKDTGFFNEFREDREKRDFVSAGAAAGVAAAFGAPVGGVLFSLEEGASFWNQALVWRIFFCSMISTFTLNIVLSAYHQHAWQLSYPGLINFGKFGDISYLLLEVPIYALMGALGGILGALHNYINLRLSIYRIRYLHRPWTRLVEAMLVAALTATIGYFLIHISDDCQKFEYDLVKYPVRGRCQEGEYSVMSSLWLNTPESVVHQMFHGDDKIWTVATLSIFVVFYFLLASCTYGLSVSNGLFIPSLLIGGAWGRLCFMLVKYIAPDNSDWADGCKFALIGSAAMLGGVVRMTLSLTVIMIETTGNITFGPPLMITLIFAKWIGDYFMPESIYELHIRLASVPFLPWEPPSMSSTVYASEIMSVPVVTLKAVEKVGRIIEILEKETHNGFPVVDMDSSVYESSPNTLDDSTQAHFGRFRGLVLRWQLIILLQEKFFEENAESTLKTLNLQTFRAAYPRYPPVEKVVDRISQEERNYHIDLRPVMNPSAYSVIYSSSLNRIFQLFRALGLRHLVVVNDRNEVVGIVTRKDIARYREHVHGGRLSLQTLQISIN